MDVMEVSARVKRLKEGLLNLSHVKYRVEKELTVLTDEEIKKEPVIVRKALALDLLLRFMPIYIQDDELIVGGKTMALAARQDIFADPDRYQQSWSSRYFPHYATEEEREEAAAHYGSWASGGWREGDARNHLAPNWEKVLSRGLKGIKREALEKLRSINAEKFKDEAAFLRAAVVSLDAATNYIRRYAVEAQRLANIEADDRRKMELQKISDILDWVALNPPRTFYEALQLLWMVYCVEQAEINDWIQSARFDQYMYPFYGKDIEEGRMTKEEAEELLECLWIKFNTTTDLNEDDGCNMILGGQTKDGRDATNELSYLILDVTEALKLPDPKVNIRVHKGTPESFLRRVCEILATGQSTPAVYNDEVVIPSMLKAGYSPSEVLNWSNDGCCEPIIPGKTLNWPSVGSINMLKSLVTALEGLEKFETFEELMEAFKRQLKLQMNETFGRINENDEFQLRSGLYSSPFTSAITDDCIEKMKDLSAGGAVYNYTGAGGTGLANVADSLAAVKKLVFEEKKIGKRELLEALHTNFKGVEGERLRQLLLNKVPKFGNDDDYVDLISKEVAEYFCGEVLKYSNPRGGIFIPAFWTFGAMVTHGQQIGATPDGRKAGEFIAPNFSPSPGRDVRGPTAVIKSITKIDHTLLANGMALDMRFHPTALRGSQGIENLMSMLKTYFDLGGFQLNGLSVVDADTLRDAQKHPEQYSDLQVRVFGFSAYFVTLNPDFQEHMIQRSEHGF